MNLDQIYQHYNISKKQLELLQIFKQEVLSWNTKHNLISRKSETDIWQRHILNSLQLLDLIDNTKTNSIIDVGSGGGFPGIVLAIMLPQTHLTLIDSSHKKTHVLTNISNTLNLKNTTIICDRIENINLKCDIITARALSSITNILQLIKNIQYSRILLLKGISVHQELTKECTLHSGKLGSFIVEILNNNQ